MEWPPAIGMPASAQIESPPSRMVADHVLGQLVDRHADDGQREDRPAAHGVNVGERVGRGDAAEVARIVDDGHEEIGGGDDGLRVVQAIDGRVVGCLDPHQEIGRQRLQRRFGDNARQHGRRDLAASTAAVAELGQFDVFHGSCSVGKRPKDLPEGLAKVAQLADFDAIIDARSPAEYAEDHIPGAISCPVLDDEERARVGTLYKQVSPFEARKARRRAGGDATSPATSRRFPRQAEELAAAGLLLARRPAQRCLHAHPARNRLGRASARRRLQDLAPAGGRRP